MIEKLWEILNYSPGEDVGLIDTSFFVAWVHSHIVSSTQFFQEILMTTPTIFMTTEGFWFVYRKTTKLSIIVLFFVFLEISIKKINGKKVDTSRLVEKVIVYVIITKVGPHIMIKIIDVFNRMVSILINVQDGIIPGKGSESLAIIFFLIVFMIMVLRLLLFYFERIIWLILYTVIIPIVLALRCSNRFGRIGSNLIGEIANLLIIKLAHALVLLILGTIIMGVSQLDPFIALGCQVGALSTMNKMEQKIISFFAGCAKHNAPNIHEGLERYQKYYGDYSRAKRIGSSFLTNIKFLGKIFGGG